MATAQVLRATHAVDDRVASVDGKVKDVGDKVAVVMRGAQPSLMSCQGNMFNLDIFRGKTDKGSRSTNGR
jgi:hypothetical protein